MAAAAIHNIAERLLQSADNHGDFILRYNKDAIVEYNNADLFPGMFPTLYPLGIGGFEDSRQCPKVSIEAHAEHLLDDSSRLFRYHHFFSFVILNLIQRRKAHLHTSISVASQKFEQISTALLSVTPYVLSSLANHLKHEKDVSHFTEDEQNAFRLLKEVNFISAKIPGSQAAKSKIRQNIRSYYAYFGLPHLFVTLNPSAVHSPVFQVIYGDQNVDLSADMPFIVQPRSERAYRLACDPVAGADFFEFMYRTIFGSLFGWDFEKGKSVQNGGIFGHLRAFFGCAE
ncbi:hypothetical protein EV359DRAFT_48206, partial [Lentinula novae-zelandiae]